MTIVVTSAGGLVTPARADIVHVTNCSDSDPGSLRAVVAGAANGDTVVFDLDCIGAAQITLSSEILVTGKAVTVDGTGHRVTISGGDMSRIFNAGGGGTLILKRLTLTHGAAGDGGALVATGSLTLEDITVSSSTASLNGGGAIATFGGATLFVARSTFTGNSAPLLGGAIYNNDSTASIETSTFTGNQVGGGGLGIGGGVASFSGGVMAVSRSTFAGNTADNSGGAVKGADNAQVTLANSTLTDNTAMVAGGGISISGSMATIENVTFSGNHIPAGLFGSEIDSDGRTTVLNTIVSGSSGGNCSGTITNGGNNLQFGDTTCGFSLTGDPRLGPLADNTGPTQTMALGQGSLAIDAANPAICRQAGVDNIDQRGQFRTNAVRSTCDIGAFDSGGSVIGPASGSTTAISCSPCRIKVGAATTITVQAKSASGQSRTVGGDTVTLAATRGTLSAVTDNGNGTYTATLQSATKPSKATISGTINGQQITATATVKVTAAAPSAAKTIISARRSRIPEARGRTQIVVDTRDRFGNNVPTGGAKIRLRSTSGRIRDLRDLHNGNYAARLHRNREENQKVVVTGTINGKRIKDTAVVFFS
jgi:predicted outer membrane repeat protein